MEASRKLSGTSRHLPSCSDVSVLQKMRMSHFWDTHHKLPAHLMSWLKIQKSLFKQA